MNLSLFLKTKLLSLFLNSLNPTNQHNFQKFQQIKNIWINIFLDNLEGDYIEFGIFKGKSLYHSFKTFKRLYKDDNKSFYGLDSFEGFPVENHNFYKNENFKSSYKKVSSTFKKYKNIHIESGFFSESLKKEKLIKVKKICFAFVDCDIYESSLEVFEYLKPRMVPGGFIMIDDFLSIDKNGKTIMNALFLNYELNKNIFFYSQYSNGQVFRIIEN
mgnify:FL=1|tara:strand:- start:269 stop:916 length:648 start_codon:yes stop_codon:yes gene_type:complete